MSEEMSEETKAMIEKVATINTDALSAALDRACSPNGHALLALMRQQLTPEQIEEIATEVFGTHTPSVDQRETQNEER